LKKNIFLPWEQAEEAPGKHFGQNTHYSISNTYLAEFSVFLYGILPF